MQLPDVFQYGDSDLAWCPQTKTGDSGTIAGDDPTPVTARAWNVTKIVSFSHNPTQLYALYGFTEYIELQFSTPVYPTGIKVGENRGMCSIVRIQGRSSVEGSTFIDLWKSRETDAQRAVCSHDFSQAKRYRVFQPDICEQPFKVDVLRIELDTRSVTDWNEIDFVELTGSTALLQGVLPANTSGLFYVPNPSFVGEDRLSIIPCTLKLAATKKLCRGPYLTSALYLTIRLSPLYCR
jgi:hypothetical protein